MVAKIKRFVNPAPLFKKKWCWIKRNKQDIILALVVFLISLVSFAVGIICK